MKYIIPKEPITGEHKEVSVFLEIVVTTNTNRLNYFASVNPLF